MTPCRCRQGCLGLDCLTSIFWCSCWCRHNMLGVDWLDVSWSGRYIQCYLHGSLLGLNDGWKSQGFWICLTRVLDYISHVMRHSESWNDSKVSQQKVYLVDLQDIAVFLNGKDITMREHTLCGQINGLIQRIPQGRHHSEDQGGVIYSEMHRDR